MNNRTENSVLLVLKKRCKKAGSQKNYAKKIGVSEQYLSEIIRGTRPLSDNFLERIGFEKVVFYKEKHLIPVSADACNCGEGGSGVPCIPNMQELIEKLHSLADRWDRMATKQVPAEYAKRNLHGKYLRLDNEAAGLSNCADELRELLNIESRPTRVQRRKDLEKAEVDGR